MRTELVDRRTPRSKTFLNEDGSFTTEVGGSHAHHLKDGAFVDTDCYLYGGNTELVDELSGETYTHETREHPVKIRLNKFRQPLRVGGVILRPIGANQVTGVKSLNTVTYAQAWPGIDVKRVVVPEGLIEEITVTSAEGQRLLQWGFVGDLGVIAPPTWALGSERGFVDVTLEGNLLTYDLTAVPVGSVVR